MVDALKEAHRALRPGGTLIDLRPDSDHQPRVFRGGRAVGGLYERPTAVADNHFSDRAVARLVREGELRTVRRGHFWYALPSMDLPTLDRWLAESGRLGGYTRGTHRLLARDPGRPIVVKRALAYGIYERV
ncbi:MAG: hypothetical protein M3Z65_06185 [Chloroflexota bacterium]|nr:hypothetical protein [Chloroflexota bacterium]